MTWGHAVSSDLVHWQELEPALRPDNGGDIWSGSAVLDFHNVTGLQQSGDEPPMLAFYTNMGGFGEQRLAVSKDHGRTWAKIAKAVVPAIPQIDENNRKNARDPKVEWHAPSKRWIMVLFHGYRSSKAVRVGSKPSPITPWPSDTAAGVGVFGIYNSKDLLSWELTQELEIDGDSECPDLFELPVTKASGVNTTKGNNKVDSAAELADAKAAAATAAAAADAAAKAADEAAAAADAAAAAAADAVERKYVLVTAGGSYLVGEFDGKRFKATQPSQHMEFGDGYAPQTFNNMPNGRRVQLAWLGHNNARTCKRSAAFSDEPFTGQMSIPMELDLVKVSDGRLRIRRQPARELHALRQKPLLTVVSAELDSSKPIEVLPDEVGTPLEVLLRLRANSSSSVAKIKLQLAGHELELDLEQKASDKSFFLGLALGHENQVFCRAVLASRDGLRLPLETDSKGIVTLRAVVDRHSLELFDYVGGGSMALCSPSLCRSGEEDYARRVVRLTGHAGNALVEEFKVWPLHSQRLESS